MSYMETALVPYGARTTAWRVCLIASLYLFYDFIQMNMFSAIQPALMHDFAINATALGNFSAIFFTANLLFLIPAGLLLDRYSTRQLIFFTMLLSVLGTFCMAFAEHLSAAMLSRFITGITSAFCFLCCIRLASRWFPPKQWAFVFGIIITIGMLGGLLAQTPFTVLAQHYGWRFTMQLNGMLGIVILGLVYWGVQDFPTDPTGAALEQAQAQIRSAGFFAGLSRVYGNPQNWLAGCYASFLNLSIYLLGALWGSLFVAAVFHYTKTQASAVTSMVYIGSIIGAPLVGKLSDYFGERRKLMLVGALLSIVCFLPLYFSHYLSLPVLIVLFFCLGLTTSTQVLSYPLVSASNPVSITASAVSVVSFCIIGGGVVFQPLFGGVMDMTHQQSLQLPPGVYEPNCYYHALLIIPIAFTLSFFAAFFLRDHAAKEQA